MGSMCKTELGVVPRLFFCVLICFKIEKILLFSKMAWDRGYEQHNSWPGSAEEILQRMQDEERLNQVGERYPLQVSPRNEPTGWDRYPTGGIDPLGDRSERIEVIPYSEEETNAKKWGLLNSFVDMIKRTGGKLMDRYQQNKEDRRKWQEENPGGYPGMPQHLRERLRRNESSAWMPREDALIAHVNADGTAHDYREPGHINFRVPGGVYNPHGIRGSITHEDGSAAYSKEELLRGIRDGRINRNYLSDDDRFWPQNTRPGDGSSMTPESQKLYDSIMS